MSAPRKTLADEVALITDLNSTFPGARACSLGVWANDPESLGAVVCGEAEIEPGFPIGPYVASDADEYRGGSVHLGFIEWAERRGWHVESCEPGTLWLSPLTDFDASLDAWVNAWAAVPHAPLQPGECPF